MNFLHRIGLFVSLALLVCGSARAEASFILEGDTVKVSGAFELPDGRRFNELLNAHPRVRRVEFADSRGGSATAGLQIARAIRARKLATVVRAYCFSACARAFLGGTDRSFSTDSGFAIIGLHSPVRMNGESAPLKVREEALQDVLWLTDGKLQPFAQAILESDSMRSGIFFIRATLWGFSRDRTVRCMGTEETIHHCPTVQGKADPLTAGIVTR